jgi:hypothetical protein
MSPVVSDLEIPRPGLSVISFIAGLTIVDSWWSMSLAMSGQSV